MKIEIDTLTLCNRLTSCGFSAKQAEGVVQGLSKTELHNLYSKDEVDEMLSDTVKQTFEYYNQQWRDERLLLENRTDKALERFETRCDQVEIRLDQRVRSSLLWTITTIVTVGIALAGLIHFTH